MKTNTYAVGCLAFLLSAIAAIHCAVAAPYAMTADGRKIEGTKIRATRDGQIIVTTAGGDLTFPAGTKAFVEKPVDLTGAGEMMRQKRYDEAIRQLTKVVEEYKFLQWDNEARALLGLAYVNQKDYKAAVGTYEDLFRDTPEARKDGAALAGYAEALAGLNDTAKLTPLLDELCVIGPRKAAGAALVTRGKVKLAAGDIENALYDFLRSLTFFKDATDVQAEANFRAAECFEKLRDKRAAEYFAIVVKDFPDSPFAAQAKARPATP